MGLVAASILDADFSYLKTQVEDVCAGGIDFLSLDVMDGLFVPNISFGPTLVAQIREWTDLLIETHLMVREPSRWIERFFLAGADLITFHVEASADVMGDIARIASLGAGAGLALNLETSVEALPNSVLESVSAITLMTIAPGFGGQGLNNDAISKIADLDRRRDELGARFWIQVDGGVKLENVPNLVTLGAEVLVVGTGIYREKHPIIAVQELKRAAAQTTDSDIAVRVSEVRRRSALARAQAQSNFKT